MGSRRLQNIALVVALGLSILLFISELSYYSTGLWQSMIADLESHGSINFQLTNGSSITLNKKDFVNSQSSITEAQGANETSLTSKNEVGREDIKLLLAYTSFYGNVLPKYLSEYDKSVVVAATFRHCKYKCKWTTNRQDYNRSEAVIFHLYNNLDMKDFVLSKLPTRRSVNQKWVLIVREPPAFYYPDQLKLLDDMFNLTMTYQSTADVSIPYGGYWNLTEHQKLAPPKNYLQGRDKMVVWLVSNCITSSRREKYVEQLQKYLEIDVFGECGKVITGKYNRVIREIAAKYKFYIAFENSDCQDYITEKFWRSLHLGMIPIVRGLRVDYKRLAPPKSYIHADSFITPKALADYLKEIAVNPKLFQKHHEWRQLYDANFRQFTFNKDWMCDLCTQVHTSKRKTVDVYQEFSETIKCFTYQEGRERNRTGEHVEDISRL